MQTLHRKYRTRYCLISGVEKNATPARKGCWRRWKRGIPQHLSAYHAGTALSSKKKSTKQTEVTSAGKDSRSSSKFQSMASSHPGSARPRILL